MRFYPLINGTTAGTPGTGAFTPNAAVAGYRAWSKVPTGWVGPVLYQDTSNAWELTWSYWNGTTLSRASTQVYDSSTGSQLTLTSSATAALVVDPFDVTPALAGENFQSALAQNGGTTFSTMRNGSSVSVTGTVGSNSVATSSFINEQITLFSSSATTASAQAGFSMVTNGSTAVFPAGTSGRGGFLFQTRWGSNATLPTSPRLFLGVTDTSFAAQTIEPSAFAHNFAAFTLDSTDTSIQFTTGNTTARTKNSTAMAFVINGFYEGRIWVDPGGSTYHAMLIRWDTGAVWVGSNATNLPANVVAFWQALGGLNGTNTGTAIVFGFGGAVLRSGF